MTRSMSQVGKRAIHLSVDSRIKQICRRVCGHSGRRPISRNDTAGGCRRPMPDSFVRHLRRITRDARRRLTRFFRFSVASPAAGRSSARRRFNLMVRAAKKLIFTMGYRIGINEPRAETDFKAANRPRASAAARRTIGRGRGRARASRVCRPRLERAAA